MNINSRNTRAQKAKQTLEIIDNGFYEVDGKQIFIEEETKYSISNSLLYTPINLENILKQAELVIKELNYKTNISVNNSTTMEAAVSLLKENQRLACLNFASAKNPGGGFLGGSQAQEESLARASSLYPTLMKYFNQMYEYNRQQQTYLYSDYMIYSPDVVFFKDDSDSSLVEPYLMDVLTSPAVNVGAMKKNKPDELTHVDQVMMARLDKILSVFVLNGVENLILGAWGCGVFQNNPQTVAEYFAYYLKNNGKYSKCFKNIIFAIYARERKQENITAFEKIIL